ncbi:Ig-like domain-containing protein [Luedemannella flava]
MLPHDNSDTPLSGTAWPGDTVKVTDQDGNTVCTTVAKADGTWSCTAAETFPNGTTSLKVSEHGTGANNPEYPGLSSAGLPDLAGNTVRTAVITSDPAVMKSINDATPKLGDVVTYTIVATNNGPNTAVSCSVADALPDGVEYVSSTTTAGTFDPATGAWTGIGDLDKGERQTLTIKAKVIDRGTIINPAEITATAATDGTNTSRLRGADGVPDWNLNPANDADTAVLETVPSADPQLTKRVDQRAHELGDVVVYTLVATNNGPDEATGVYVSDPLPEGLEFVSAAASVGTYDEAADRWAIGNLPTTLTATLTLRARATQPGTIRNTATIAVAGSRSGTKVGSNPGDANTNRGNDADSAVIEVPDSSGTVPVTNPGSSASGSSQPSWAGSSESGAASGNMDSLPVTGAPATVVALLGLGAVLSGLAVIFGARYAYRRRTT